MVKGFCGITNQIPIYNKTQGRTPVFTVYIPKSTARQSNRPRGISGNKVSHKMQCEFICRIPLLGGRRKRYGK